MCVCEREREGMREMRRGRGEERKRDKEREEERERPVSFFDRATTLSQRDQERQNFNRFFFSLSLPFSF